MADTVQQPRAVFSRVWNYPIVHYAVGTASSYYTYAKTYHQYSQRVFEIAESYVQPVAAVSLAKLEEYTHQPLVEGIINRADAFGCQQLDKIEERIHNIKEFGPKTFHTVIHGTKVESVLIKTVSIVDNVVDALLPPVKDDNSAAADNSAEGSDDPEIRENGVSLVEVTGPVIHKLKTRVSKKSVLRLPLQTYSGLHGLAVQNTNSLSVLLKSASASLLATKQAKKGAELSKASVDYVYQSLHRVSSSVNSLAGVLKRLDAIEARATVAELSHMIASSKENVSKIIDNLHLAQKLKEDSSAILLRAGDALSRPLEAGYVLVANSDIAAIRNAFVSLESAVQGVVTSFSVQAEHTSE